MDWGLGVIVSSHTGKTLWSGRIAVTYPEPPGPPSTLPPTKTEPGVPEMNPAASNATESGSGKLGPKLLTEEPPASILEIGTANVFSAWPAIPRS